MTAPPQEMYGKTLSVPDAAMGEWYSLLLGREVPSSDPRSAKHELARSLVSRYHGEDAASAAAEHFHRVFVAREVPEVIEEVDLPAAALGSDGTVHLPAVIAESFGRSRSEARRLLAQGGVKVDGEALGADEADVSADRLDGAVLQVGKRRFRRLRRAT